MDWDICCNKVAVYYGLQCFKQFLFVVAVFSAKGLKPKKKGEPKIVFVLAVDVMFLLVKQRSVAEF